VTSFFKIKVCVFLKKTRWICAKYFSGFRSKHLFITTCNEKQCTRPFKLRLNSANCIAVAEIFRRSSQGNKKFDANNLWYWCYPDPSDIWDCVETSWSSSSRATQQDLNQKIKDWSGNKKHWQPRKLRDSDVVLIVLLFYFSQSNKQKLKEY